jgi:hypothetical protein
VGDKVVVPAFAAVEAASMEVGVPRPNDPLSASVQDALTLSADLVHRGWRHLPPSWATRGERAAQELRSIGLLRAADAVQDLVMATRSGTPTSRSSGPTLT